MQQFVRNAVARIDVMQQGKSISRGTGCLVADGLVLTALHVIADRKQESLALIPGEIVLTFPSGEVKAAIHENYWDRMADWALLRCQTLPDIRPVPLADLHDDGDAWETYGFPDANPRDGMANIGEVSNCLGTLEGNPVFQLFCREAAAGQGEPVKGLSGSPVIVQNAVVGVLRFALMKEGLTVAGTVYACPIASVLKKAGELLPLPDPCFGLPGLPQRALPEEPFRYLSWFTEKEAEVFFGRNREIRQMYTCLTADAASPIMLFYGQSGVGKSSFLDAGVLPRLRWYYQVCYLRRDAHATLLTTLRDALNALGGEPAASAPDLAGAWKAVEQNGGKPLVVFFDQLEEVYTHASTQSPNELREFAREMGGLFAGWATRSRLVLSFRKEWLSEIEKHMEQNHLDRVKVFLEGLNGDSVVEAVTGLNSTTRLQQKYGLTIQAGLAAQISAELLADRGSPIAPTLQILLTKMWRKATAISRSAPQWTMEMYQALKQEGLLLGDFLDQQLEALAALGRGAGNVVSRLGPGNAGRAKTTPETWVKSGFALDVLTYHTTAFGTARECALEELLKTYKHCGADISELIQALQTLFLLSGTPGDDERKATRLSHDTLAPAVRQRYARSEKPAQRARRIIEGRVDDWDGKDEHALDGVSVAMVERGLDGMRALTVREDELLAASRRKRSKDTRVSRILRAVGALGVILITALSVVASVAYFGLKKRQAVLDLEAKAALVQTRLPNRPLNALLFAIAATADSLDSQRRVLPAIQFALGSAMVQATEAGGIRETNLTGAAATPDGSTLATSSGRKTGSTLSTVVTVWNGQGVSAPSPPPFPFFAGNSPLALRSQGDLLAVGGAGLWIWDRQLKALTNAIPIGGAGPRRAVLSTTFTPLGDYLLSGETDGKLRVWTLDGHELMSTDADRGQPPAVNAIAAVRGAHGETVVATGGQDGYVRLWRLEAQKLSAAYPEKEFKANHAITSVGVRVRNNRLSVAAGDSSGAVWIWSDDSAATYPLGGAINAVAIHPEFDTVAVTGRSGAVRFLDFRGVQIAPDFTAPQQEVASLAFLAGSSRLLVAAGDKARLLDTGLLGGSRRIGAFDSFLSDGGDQPVGAAFLAGGAVVAGTSKGELLLWDGRTGAASRIGPASDKGLTGGLTGLTANREGTLIAGSGGNGHIYLFDAGARKVGDLAAPSGTSGAAIHMVFSPDGKKLAANYSGDHIALWNTETREKPALIQLSGAGAKQVLEAAFGGLFTASEPVSPQQTAVFGQAGCIMAFTADSGRLAVAWPDHQGLRLWDMRSQFPSAILQQVPGNVMALAFRPDGRGFVTIFTGGAVGRWTMEGKLVDEQMIHPSKGKAVWLGMDAETQRLFMVDEFGVRMGNYPAPKVNQEFIASFNAPSPINSAALSVEEDAIVTVDHSGAVRIWPAHWRAFLRESCDRLHDHIVFRDPGYSEGLGQDVIERAYKFCAAQVWGK